jgi:ABC-type polysaccharide/polyol phosphate export permease
MGRVFNRKPRIADLEHEVSQTQPQIQSYFAEDAPRGVLRHLLPIVRYPSVLSRHRWLIANFFRRELLGRFRGSALGIFWVLVQPLFQFAVYYLVFGMLFGNWKTGQLPDPTFAIYLFSGIIAFNALLEGTTRSCSVVLENGNLVKKVAFPSELLPVPVILVGLMVYLVAAVVCVTAGMAFGVIRPGFLLLALPLVLMVQMLLTLGIGLLLATCQVFARDTGHLWGILGMAWFFLSPIFWFPSLIREKLGDLAVVFTYNPAYPLLQCHRLAFGIRDDSGILGSFWPQLGVAALWAVSFLVLGYSVFMSRRHKFADLV